MIRIRAARLTETPTPGRDRREPDCTVDSIEELFWERRFDDASLDDVAEIPPLADETIALLDLRPDLPVIRWRASPLDGDVIEPPPICWHPSP